MSLIHTCYRITDIDRSVAFYNALGFNEIGRLPIRDEAINVFMGLPDDGPEPRLELTYNIGHDAPYDLGTGYGHIAITTPDLDPPSASSPSRESRPSVRPTESARAAPVVFRERSGRLPDRVDRARLIVARDPAPT